MIFCHFRLQTSRLDYAAHRTRPAEGPQDLRAQPRHVRRGSRQPRCVHRQRVEGKGPPTVCAHLQQVRYVTVTSSASQDITRAGFV